MKHNLINITLNFTAFILLLVLIATPLYFARNFTKVAGIKNTTPYLVVSQIEKFPSMKLEQHNNSYLISFTKTATSQAYLAVLILNNPTSSSQTYSLKTSSTSQSVFFGEDLDNKYRQINVPSGVSIPISLFSPNSEIFNQSIEFFIENVE